jgi:hypothetical protein
MVTKATVPKVKTQTTPKTTVPVVQAIQKAQQPWYNPQPVVAQPVVQAIQKAQPWNNNPQPVVTQPVQQPTLPTGLYGGAYPTTPTVQQPTLPTGLYGAAYPTTPTVTPSTPSLGYQAYQPPLQQPVLPTGLYGGAYPTQSTLPGGPGGEQVPSITVLPTGMYGAAYPGTSLPSPWTYPSNGGPGGEQVPMIRNTSGPGGEFGLIPAYYAAPETALETVPLPGSGYGSGGYDYGGYGGGGGYDYGGGGYSNAATVLGLYNWRIGL